jgi:hypothetical protein
VSHHGTARMGGGEQSDGGGTCLGIRIARWSELVSERDVEREEGGVNGIGWVGNRGAAAAAARNRG